MVDVEWRPPPHEFIPDHSARFSPAALNIWAALTSSRELIPAEEDEQEGRRRREAEADGKGSGGGRFYGTGAEEARLKGREREDRMRHDRD